MTVALIEKDRGRTATPAMLTDRYELTMLSSWIADGKVNDRAVFECFGRRLPKGRRYGVVAGLGRLLPLIRDFQFDVEEIEYLSEVGAITPACATYLIDFRFTGDIDAYREGDLYFPNSPILTVAGTLGECVLLETLILSVLNFDSAIASAAARMVSAADGRPIIEMGSRRTHEQSAIAAARAAYIAGFTATSNLAAGFTYGVPTTGTAAHAFTMSYRDEKDAFASQVRALGVGTSLLVDTYDIEQGIRTAVDVAGHKLGAIRIDSGDLAIEARKARTLLDELGAPDTRIIVTSDLDEYVIAALGDAPIDGFGVGTRLVTGSKGGPNCGMVYKLVAVADSPDSAAPLRSVSKKATGKVSIGGRKIAYRELDNMGHAVAERIVIRHVADSHEGFPGRVLTIPVMRHGQIAHSPSLDEIRAFHTDARSELSPSALGIADTITGPELTATL